MAEALNKSLFDECVFAFVISRDLSKATANGVRIHVVIYYID